jgi:hydroxymethylpyrimidine/phosphomethylpyrimidine kinase
MTELHSAPDDTSPPQDQEGGAPACVLCFNASEPTGAAGLGADIATIAAMGAHALPVCTGVIIRDTAEIFESQALDPDTVAEQARAVLEDASPSAWKLGFLGNADVISAVAEIVSDYADIPLVAHLPNLSWLSDDEQMAYLDAFKELILPGTMVLSGNHKTLTDFLLPDWDAERQPSARELAVAAAEHGASYVFVTGIHLPDQFIDNVLASPEGAIAGERFERFEVAFVGAGDTLSAALAATLSSGTPLDAAVSEALSFLDQSLDAGFRPGMGGVVPDRFFWALPPGEEGAEDPAGATDIDDGSPHDGKHPPTSTRNIH